MNIDTAKLGLLTVQDESGNATLVSEFWKSKIAMLVFLRHFGCIACRAQVKEMWARNSQYAAKGCQLIFIGNGSPKHIKRFKEDFGINVPIYTDPSLATYRAAGFKKSLIGTVGPKAIIFGQKLRSDGHVSDGIQGNVFQQGGVLCIDQQGKLLFGYVSKHLGDFPKKEDIEASQSS
jgi:peroxiredoxin